MAITVGRIVLSGLKPIPVCVVPILENALQTVRIDVMDCCVKDIDLCIAQSADKSFIMVDRATVDYSAATEITFNVWQGIGGTLLLSKSFDAGTIILPNDYSFSFSVTGAESNALSAGRKYCEAWVTLSGGERRAVGVGNFRVIDTRKHD